MKKAQVLSAIALALALGVVAPIAGTTVSAIEYGATESEGKASQAEVQNAIAYVKNDADYKAMSGVLNAYLAYYNNSGALGQKLYDNFTTGSGTAYDDAASGMRTNDATFAVSGVANIFAPANTAEAQKVLDAIFDNPAYKAYTDLSKAMNDANVTRSALVAAIAAYNNAVLSGDSRATFTDDELGDDYTYPVSYLKGKVAYRTSSAYTKFDGIAKKATAAQEQLNKNNAAVAMLKAVLTNDILSTTGKNKLADADKTGIARDYANIVNTGTISSVSKIGDIMNSATFQGANFITELNNLKGWAALMNTVDTTTTTRSDSQANYTAIATLANNYKAAVKSSEPLTTTLMATMAGYNAPSTPSDKPTEGDKDEEKDPAAPGTGIVSTAEGNAATTVSIVAGLATALTALGAGVVAYRNARRN